jgi:hypothetical protein
MSLALAWARSPPVLRRTVMPSRGLDRFAAGVSALADHVIYGLEHP